MKLPVGFAKWAWTAAVLTLLFSLLPVGALAAPAALPREQGPANDLVWSDADALALARAGAPQIETTQARVLRANVPLLQSQLASAPLEGQADGILFALPMPDGSSQYFQVVNSPIMEAKLAAKYPQISTYLGQGVDDQTATVRMDWTPQGFHAMILSAAGTVYIDPFRRGDTSLYISYYKDNFVPRPQQRIVELDASGEPSTTPPIGPRSMRVPSGSQLRTYRLAMAATGEYTAYHGGTVPLALAAIVTAMNRVNGIYEREVAIRMVLVANTDDLIYTMEPAIPTPTTTAAPCWARTRPTSTRSSATATTTSATCSVPAAAALPTKAPVKPPARPEA